MANQPLEALAGGQIAGRRGANPLDTPPGWVDLCIAAGVASVSFCAYLLTLAPGLLRADGGQFQTLAVTLGYAHPNGSPVYLLLARLATWLPLGEAAYRVNLLSAVMGAVAVGLVYLVGSTFVGRRWISLAGAAALAVSPTFWSQAIVAGSQVSAVTFMAAILLCLGLWERTGRCCWLFLAGCLGGAGIGVHVTVALMAPAGLILICLRRQSVLANWTAALLGLAVGLSALLAAFALVDRADSPTSYFRTVIGPSRSEWGLKQENIDDFRDRVELSIWPLQYRDIHFLKPPEAVRLGAADYLKNLPREFPPLWLAASGAGLFWLAGRTWKLMLLLVLTYATHLLVDLHSNVTNPHLLYIATYVPVAVSGVAGLAFLGQVTSVVLRRRNRTRRSQAVPSALLAGLGLAVVVSPMCFPAAWNVEGRRCCWVPPEADPFRVEYSAEFHRQVRKLVDSLEEDAVLFVQWDWLYPCYYVAHVEQGRSGMVFIEDYPLPYQRGLADSALEYVKETASNQPVYFTHVVEKVEVLFELQRVRRGDEVLYRVGEPVKR